MQQIFEMRSLSYSIVLHALVLLVAAVGLPMLLPKPPEPMPLVMSVDIMPIGDITNVKPSDKPIQEEQKAPTPKNTKPIPPVAQEKPKPTPTPPTPKPKEPPPEEKHFDPMEGADEPLPSEKPKPPEPQKPVEKPAEKPQPKNDDFAALMSKWHQEDAKSAKDAKDKTNTDANKTQSDAPYDASLPMSMSEKDAIRSQFIACWFTGTTSGAKDAHTLAVRVKVQFQPDGSVADAKIASDQQGRYNSDQAFRAAADSALRAVHKCSPLKNLPADKFNSWREMEMNFDPVDAL